MQEEVKPRIMDVGLEAIIQFQHADGNIGCIIRDIARDYTEVIVMASDQRICTEGDVEIKVILPTERSPIRFTGKIVWYSRDSRDCLARVAITRISRIERRRLELVIAQKKACDNSGRPSVSDSQQLIRLSSRY